MKLGIQFGTAVGVFLAIGTLLLCHITGAALTFKMAAKKANVEDLKL